MAARSPRCAPTTSPPSRSAPCSSAIPAIARPCRRGLSRLRQPGGRGQPQRRAHGALLAGLPDSTPGVTLNRLCASGLDAVGAAARAIQVRRDRARHRRRRGIDVARALRHGQGGAGLPAHGGDLRHDHRLALHQPADEGSSTASIPCRRPARTSRRNSRSAAPTRTPSRCARSSAPAAPRRTARFADAIVAGRGRRAARPGRSTVDKDEHPRADTTLEALAKLKPIVRPDGTVTAGNASGVNDGAAAMILASAEAVERHGLTPLARVLGMASRRRAAAHHGHRPGARRGQADRRGSASRSAIST